MSDDTLNDEGPDEGDSLSETIAAALEEDQGEDIIAELGRAESEAPETPETPETDEKALSDAGSGDETPGDEGDGQTEETEPPSTEAREEADTEPEPGTATADQYRQMAEIYHDAVAPYREHLASRGVVPSQAIRLLLAAEHQLSTGTPERKAEILTQLAKDYGVSLADMEDVEPVNPQMAQLHQRLGGIERTIQSQRQQGEVQVRQSVEAEVAAFTDEKDRAGNLLRPHLGKVGAAMGRMIGKNPNLTLQAAYDKAVKADPKLSQASVAKQRAAPVAKRSQAGKAKATAKPANEQTLHDTVTEAFRRDAERLGA